MTRIMQVVTTTDSETSAQQIGQWLVERRLAACVQIDGPIRSIYRWQGQMESAQEWRCTIKTTAPRLEGVQQHIRSLHSYDVPEIIATQITDSSREYAQWLEEQVAEDGE